MADIFVSSFWGDDTNDGLTVATAKETIQAGVSAISANGDNIFVYPGTYKEGDIDNSTFRGNLIAVGKVILDGENKFDNGIAGTGTVNAKQVGVRGFEIKNYIQNAIKISDRSSFAEIIPIEKNIIHNCRIGLFATSASAGPSINTNLNLIYNCGIGLSLTTRNASESIINNTFHNCGAGIEFNVIGTDTLIIKDNIFAENNLCIGFVATNTVSSGAINEIDFNIYDVPSGELLIKTTEDSFATISGVQTIFGNGVDASSFEEDPLFANVDKRIFSVLSGSVAESGSSSGTYIGARKTEVGWYSDTIVQSGITLVDTVLINLPVQESGYILDILKLGGTIELGVIDLGQTRMVSDFFQRSNEMFPDNIIDTDTSGNSIPSGELTFEFKTADSLGALSSGSYEVLSIEEDLPSTSGRYIQARITLNGN